MTLSPGALRLLSHLTQHGILLCNETAGMPSLATIGCEWRDVTALIDAHALFYCRAYRKRSTYLSPQAYFLLRDVKPQKPLTEDAARLIAPLTSGGALEARELKRATLLSGKAFSAAQAFLLENLYITAFQNGRVISPTWSTFAFSTAEAWAEAVPPQAPDSDARQALWALLGSTMPENDFARFIR